ncbi:ABC transporter substrate-binding protein [Providencia sp. PROV174]|uniref:ABC transporter substrate-binding protein n=1 Tax=Providencia sp. PROV174 TaxID=2949877 RepID=UPI00234941E8|nr:ABC transporter substrate-binding protein [Providencia sp. PROV174]
MTISKRAFIKTGLATMALNLVPYPSFAENKLSVTDILGRSVDFPKNPERIYLADPALMFLYAALNENNFVEKLVAIPNNFRTADLRSYQQYCTAFPAIQTLPHLPSIGGAQANLETILMLQPEVIFTTTGTFSGLQANGLLALLQRVKIPVIALDMSVDPIGNTPKSISIMADVFQQQDRAKQINQFIKTQLGRVKGRLQSAKPIKPKVLLERAAGFTDECCLAYGNGNFAQFLSFAGGENVAKQYIHGTYGVLNQEAIIHTEAQMVIVTGTDWSGYNPKGNWVGLGPGADLAIAKQKLKQLMARNAFKTLSAVKQQQVHAIWHTFYDSPFGFIAVLKLASWLHPTLFADLDADNVFKTFTEQFLPVKWEEGYWVSL